MSDLNVNENQREGAQPLLFLMFYGFIAVLLLFGLSQIARSEALGEPFKWVLIVFGGFAVAAIFLFSGALIYRSLGMHSADHAMALPPHSIRGLLTFFIFAMLLGFIFFSIHQVVSGETSEEAREYINQILMGLFGIASTVIGFYFGSRSQDVFKRLPPFKISGSDLTFV